MLPLLKTVKCAKPWSCECNHFVYFSLLLFFFSKLIYAIITYYNSDIQNNILTTSTKMCANEISEEEKNY